MPTNKVRQKVDHSSPQIASDDPTPITGHDLKRIAQCASTSVSRLNLNRIEIGPQGLTASDGKILCMLNRPGRDERLYLDAKEAKSVPKASQLAINGTVEVVAEQRDGEMRTTLEHVGPESALFPRVTSVLPEAVNLVPIGVFEIAELKKLLSALQADSETEVTFYARCDTRKGACLLANEQGDMGLIMPLVNKKRRRDPGDFPKAIYEALGKDTEAAPHLAPSQPA